MHRRRFMQTLVVVTGLGGCAMAADRGRSALPPEGFVTSNGLRIRYQRTGSGPPQSAALAMASSWRMAGRPRHRIKAPSGQSTAPTRAMA